MFSKKYSYLIGFTIKWLLIALIVGIAGGSVSSFFLISLDWVGEYREENRWIYFLLPVAGFIIGLIYFYQGKKVEQGNNLILEMLQNPDQRISFRMAPLIYFSTILTHLVGGSAGREGTAVQMAGAIADHLNRFITFKPRDRKILLACGVSAGFAAVFGTPIAGMIFALEVYVIGRLRYEALIPALFSALIADRICLLWGAKHTHYAITTLTEPNFTNIALALLAGLIFAGGGWLFSTSITVVKRRLNFISYPPFKPLLGGLTLVILFYTTNGFRFAGLGIPTIVESFGSSQPLHFFLLKILFTAITVGSGFKGGEVTPLFFVGATLGSAIAVFLPLPVDLLAAMGFVAVFAAAANTPIACIFMGVELFGSDHLIFIAIACLIAYLFSGHTGIYSSQVIGSPKHLIWGLHKRKKLNQLS